MKTPKYNIGDVLYTAFVSMPSLPLNLENFLTVPAAIIIKEIRIAKNEIKYLCDEIHSDNSKLGYKESTQIYTEKHLDGWGSVSSVVESVRQVISKRFEKLTTETNKRKLKESLSSGRK